MIYGQKPILVTGSHRSGTTWAGKMISACPNVGYIHEPFNIDMPMSVNPYPFTNGSEIKDTLSLY